MEYPLWTPSNTMCSLPTTPFTGMRESEPAVTDVYNAAMSDLAKLTSFRNVEPLTFQLTSGWEDTTRSEKEACIEKATEACQVICEIIAPQARDELFQAMNTPPEIQVSPELEALMTAYKNASSRNMKLQILSIYAHNYPVKVLMELHEPYAKISKWQIKRARHHAQENGPGNLIEATKRTRVRLNLTKLDHFIGFANRPYFYQDVAYGIRTLKLDAGKTLTMPNVIRTITRSTLIQQYMKHCHETEVEPLSRSTLFRILEIREAGERKSLQGLDNIAADGSSGFEKMGNIVNEMEKFGASKLWVESTLKKLSRAVLYLKTDYSVHCREDTPCPDHCRSFALSDPQASCFQQPCAHRHDLFCERCDELKDVLNDIETKVKTQSSSMYSEEQKLDILHDFRKAKDDIFKWKCHILRSCNQEIAKQDVLSKLGRNSALIVIDWAMKFIQRRYREKQSEWYAKRGMSWHVSSVISKDVLTEQLVVTSYTHLFDACTQDWFSVLSILENLFEVMKQNHPSISKIYLRSDEAGCYHNNHILASLRDAGKRAGVEVLRYDYSEPQQGKDVCDRVLCPMKHAIQKYCNEGHNILTASNMREALLERPVCGTTASVNRVDESCITLKINNIQNFSSYHNVVFEDTGIRVWKAYGVGEGKLVPFKDTVLQPQAHTKLLQDEPFFQSGNRKMKAEKKSDTGTGLFECSVAGCGLVYERFGDLELHMEFGRHQNDVENAGKLVRQNQKRMG